jgi:uncharacterized delta-60 repeat protein
VAVDRAFGSSGSIWSGVPTERRDFFGAVTGTVLPGGTAVGLTLDSSGPTLIVEGLRPEVPVPMTRVVAVRFSPDGHAAEVGRWDGALGYVMSTGEWATALATCPAPTGGTAVLLRELQPPAYTLAGARYVIRVVFYSSNTVGISSEIPVSATALFDSHGPISIRLVPDGTGYLAVSAEADRLRVAVVPQQGAATVAPTIQLGGPGTALPGLSRLDVASVRVDGGWLSIALTAYLQHPGIGASSVGAVLRVSRSGARDTSFGDDGLWVGPLTNQYRQFVCAGQFPGGVVGIQGTDMVAFGIAPGGAGLDDPFAASGVLQRTLGGSLSSPVAADDSSHTFLFARRQDGRIVGCRFDRQGTLDTAFGAAGLAIVASDGAPATPSVLRVSSGHITLALTRQVEGWDCDRVPAVVVLDAATGQSDTTFGAGGFALHSAVGTLAAICPDGSSYYIERRADYAIWPGHRIVAETMTLRRADAQGRYERAIPLSTPGVVEPSVASLYALNDGSLLIGGQGSPAWIAKLSPTGTPDTTFGTGGLATPRPGVQGAVRVLGVRPDGRIAITFEPWLISTADPWAVALLEPNGSLDATYASAGSGFIGLSGLVVLPTADMPDPVRSTVSPFLDADGSVLCVLATVHQFDNDPPVQFGLRRITPAGVYDTTFGVGVPSVAPPGPGRQISFSAPTGATSRRAAYTSVAAAGCAWMGGKLDIVAAGTAGGVLYPSNTSPAYNVLIVSRWNPDGTLDSTFQGRGFQEAGFDPERIEFTPVGVAPLSSTQLVVYGQAGRAETHTHSVGTTTYTVTVIRRPEPAIFSVLDPGGIDTTFGSDGAEVLPVQEFQANIVAARLLPSANPRAGARLRFVCTDTQTQPIAPKDPTSTFGGVGQFVLPPGLSRPHPHLLHPWTVRWRRWAAATRRGWWRRQP